jgi:hypothetical protein
MERPDAIDALRAAEYHGIVYEPNTTTYVVGRTTPNLTRAQGLPMWRKRLYALMARNTRIGYEYFGVPTHRLLEIGNGAMNDALIIKRGSVIVTTRDEHSKHSLSILPSRLSSARPAAADNLWREHTSND